MQQPQHKISKFHYNGTEPAPPMVAADLPKLGVSKNIVLLRYQAESYNRDMSRYLLSLDKGLVRRMEGRVLQAVQSTIKRQGHCRILVPTIGSGRLLNNLAGFKKGQIELLGFDFNPRMMCEAVKQLGRSEFSANSNLIQLDLLTCDQVLSRSSYDVIVWEYSGCVVNAPVDAWKILGDLLAPSGVLIYNDYIGARCGSLRRSQEELRDAARTVGMRWFLAADLDGEALIESKDIIWTNGVASCLNLGRYADERAIVWDPTYTFMQIIEQTWFNRRFEVRQMELDMHDLMQSNVSAVFSRRSR